jgi:hypothetical protein
MRASQDVASVDSSVTAFCATTCVVVSNVETWALLAIPLSPSKSQRTIRFTPSFCIMLLKSLSAGPSSKLADINSALARDSVNKKSGF